MGSRRWIAMVLIAMFLLLETGGIVLEQKKGNSPEEPSVLKSGEPVECQSGTTAQEEKAFCPSVGGTLSAYQKYSVQTGEGEHTGIMTVERGETGLIYTLKKVQVFDSIYDAGVDRDRLLITDEAYIANNRFLLVEIEEIYTAPEGGEYEIQADVSELSAVYLSDGLAETEEYGMPPTLVYYGLCIDQEGQLFDKDRGLFFLTVADGRPVSFEIGIFCGEEYLDSGNVYLEVNGLQNRLEKVSQGDTDRKLFALLPDGT